MKPINFINPITKAQHISAAQFLRIALFGTLGLLILVGAATVYQAHAMLSIKQEVISLKKSCARFTKSLEEQQQLTKIEHELQQKIANATTTHKKQCNPHALFTTLQKSMPTGSTIASVQIHNQQVSCCVQCTQPRSVTSCVQALKKTNLLSDVRIAGLKGATRSYHATINGTLV